jgi:small subunit ribosomal protein S9
MTTKQDYFYGLGRRKSATARVRLKSGKGNITVNNAAASEYFADSKALLNELEKPFSALQEENKFDISVVVTGGGHASQADAIRLGIAKALTALNPDFKGTLRKAELLSRDDRERERKKYGLKGARKQRQFTKR